MTDRNVRGRFAPSPTGPLHFGSLVAAVGSYLSARAQGGTWLVRMEDLDPPREAKGAADDILRTLEAYGFEWDGEILYQSRRRDAYEAALDALRRQGALYACGCTRKEIADSSVHGIEGPVYPGTCRAGLAAGRSARALRVRTDKAVIAFDDRAQEKQQSHLEREIGDFVVRRADGFYAYQLAVVVDDAEQSITEIVRGADLLTSTPRQIHLQHLLGFVTPSYLHLPAALNTQGEKLSKQTRAVALARTDPVPVLWQALAFLGQCPSPEWQAAPLTDFWAAAVARWSEAEIPRQAGIVLPVSSAATAPPAQ
jgi:glutamyl-Q tRNA(Asp) synthetase